MNIFLRYDIERLKCFQKVDDTIAFENIQDNHFLAFQEVRYFNYSTWNTLDSFSQSETFTKKFYHDKNIADYRIIIDQSLVSNKLSIDFKNSGYTQISSQVVVSLPILEQEISQNLCQDSILFEPVKIENIAEYVVCYLQSFESHRTDYTTALKNMKELLHLPDANFYLLRLEGIAAGVCVSYTHDKSFLLAGGAILPLFRNKLLHKNMLKFRISQALTQNVNEVSGWAYENSISYKNMLKLGLKPSKKYAVYVPESL